MATKLTWFGHAALGLETSGYSVIVDPFLEGNPSATVSPDSVKADYILISHGHGVLSAVLLAITYIVVL